jgi:hypothetical protein
LPWFSRLIPAFTSADGDKVNSEGHFRPLNPLLSSLSGQRHIRVMKPAGQEQRVSTPRLVLTRI